MFGFGSTKQARRPLKYAGTWYDADPTRLASQIDKFVESARAKVEALPVSQESVLAIVAPHAGYIYSGAVAVASYLAAAEAGVKRVFLFGPSHYQGFFGAALTPCKSFATVFGDLSIDIDVVRDLKQDSMYQERADTHLVEHSLELQLAFIRKILGDVKIVPVLFGRSDQPLESRALADKIAGHLTDGDLIAVSSDFTHIGPRYGYTPFPADMTERLKELDMEAFSYLNKPDLEGFLSFYRRTDDTICGVYALAALLALLPPTAVGNLLDYRTSRDQITVDLADNEENSVSYLSIAFTCKQSWSQIAAEKRANIVAHLSEEEKSTLLKIARATLEFYVATGRVPEITDLDVTTNLSAKLLCPHGVFVTLYQRRHGLNEEHCLRGCIGYILPVQPLYQAVIANTVAACSRDPRFEAVTSDELEGLEIEVSVLTHPQPIESAEQIRLGVDGIILHMGQRQSVFLPKVATEYGWTIEETMAQLSSKAGLDRAAWKRNSRLEVFQAEVLSESYPKQ
jgi:AmmeMemoRadiSam system protein B/AmmeMemoRadiSam system protein A